MEQVCGAAGKTFNIQVFEIVSRHYFREDLVIVVQA